MAGPTGDVVKLTDSFNDSVTMNVMVSKGVSIVAPSQSVAPLGALFLSAKGGSGQGYLWTLTSAPSDGTVGAQTGAYRAGSSGNVVDTLQVVDSLGNSATLNLSVGDGLASNLASPSVAPKTSLAFEVTGGSGGYVWTLASNASFGTIDAAGHYTSGPLGNVEDVVKVVDSNGNSASVTVKVAGAIKLSPERALVQVLHTVQFTATGGASDSYLWSVLPREGQGSIDAAGLYTAGPKAGVDIVKAVDAAGNEATMLVVVTAEKAAVKGCGAAGGGASNAAVFATLLMFAMLARAHRSPPPVSCGVRPW